MDERKTAWHTGLMFVLLALITGTVYGPTAGFGFVNMDDDRYIYNNPHLEPGLTMKSARWAMTTMYFSNWHPLTWLSYLLDYELFELEPGGYHLTNVVLHTFNVFLLFAALKLLTGRFGASAFVAALFAVHPLHVESVAWVSERKDVLSTAFLLLVLLFYARYAKKPAIGAYLLVMLSFALGLMAKPMLVTLPFVLVLLDYWPLERFDRNGGLIPCVIEKTPLAVLSAASCVITVIAQRSGGNVISLESYPLGVRIMNAMMTYVAYIGKMLYPVHLAVFYPHPGNPGHTIPLWKAAAAFLVLVAVSALVIHQLRKRPYLAVGWFWYLGTLVPVIGIIQVGSQAMADRYTYVPLIGLFIVAAWGLPALAEAVRVPRKLSAAAATVLVIVLALLAWRQTQHWENSITLFSHAAQAVDGNYIAHNNLAGALLAEKQYRAAEAEYRKAIAAAPGYAEAHNNLGSALAYQERYKEAAAAFRQAAAIKPGYVNAHFNLGRALWELGRREAAAAAFRKVLELDPDHPYARQALIKVEWKNS